MSYVFDFGWVGEYWSTLLLGAWVTIKLTAVGGFFGVVLGVVCAWVLTEGPRWLKPGVRLYVEVIRNTPFLIQLFFVFFGLPSVGLRMSEFEAAVLTMVVNLGAYSCEIVRAGIQATPWGQIEAGLSLAMSRFEAFRHVVLVPALQRVWPALSSQLIIVMLGTAVVSQIAVEDLSFAASFIQSRTFRSFETYTLTTLIYILMAILLRQVLRLIGVLVLSRRVAS